MPTFQPIRTVRMLEFTSAGGTGGPPAGTKLTINPDQIVKFWAVGTNTIIYVQLLSSQEEDFTVIETIDHVISNLGGTQQRELIKLTGRGIVGGPGNDLPLYISSDEIIKLWPDGAGTTIFMAGLSTQQEEIDVQEDYSHIQQQLGGVSNVQ